MTADRGSLVVPFAIGDDQASIRVGTTNIVSRHADDDSPASADALTAHVKGLEILRRAQVPGGFGIAYQDWSGGIQAQGTFYDAELRAKLGGLDVLRASLVPKTAADTVAALGLCQALRAR